jgi:hypothetical protein
MSQVFTAGWLFGSPLTAPLANLVEQNVEDARIKAVAKYIHVPATVCGVCLTAMFCTQQIDEAIGQRARYATGVAVLGLGIVPLVLDVLKLLAHTANFTKVEKVFTALDHVLGCATRVSYLGLLTLWVGIAALRSCPPLMVLLGVCWLASAFGTMQKVQQTYRFICG